MTSRLIRIVVGSLLGVLAVGYGLMAYESFGIREALAATAGWILNRPGIPALHSWDEWFFWGVCAVGILGAIGTFIRTKWERVASLLAFGGSGLWALVISLAPESWRGVWFSTWVDRSVSASVTLLSIVGLGWLCTRAAKDEFGRAKVAS